MYFNCLTITNDLNTSISVCTANLDSLQLLVMSNFAIIRGFGNKLRKAYKETQKNGFWDLSKVSELSRGIITRFYCIYTYIFMHVWRDNHYRGSIVMFIRKLHVLNVHIFIQEYYCCILLTNIFVLGFLKTCIKNFVFLIGN